jgi:hypothetical protein
MLAAGLQSCMSLDGLCSGDSACMCESDATVSTPIDVEGTGKAALAGGLPRTSVEIALRGVCPSGDTTAVAVSVEVDCGVMQTELDSELDAGAASEGGGDGDATGATAEGAEGAGSFRVGDL